MLKASKKIVVLTGAGISAESGLKTFRDSNGLWEKYDINEVATIEAWRKNPELVLKFYDERRKQVFQAEPNPAHYALAKLEEHFDVQIITQNIDDLHERSGSTNVLHLHGEINKGRSTRSDAVTYPIEGSIKLGDLTPDGYQMRPHVVWFGEPVPKIPEAEALVRQSDVLIVVGTSLNVYPAASLIFACPSGAKKYLIDPGNFDLGKHDFVHFQGQASIKTPFLVEQLIADHYQLD